MNRGYKINQIIFYYIEHCADGEAAQCFFMHEGVDILWFFADEFGGVLGGERVGQICPFLFEMPSQSLAV